MATRQNQVPMGTTLFEPGVSRRLDLIVDRGDRDHLVPGTGIAMDEFHQYQLLGRQLQARVMASTLTSLLEAVLRPLGKLAAASRRALARADAIRELGSLDDHLLRDIGIRRGDIPAAVAGLMERPPIAQPAPTRAVLKAVGQAAACNDPHARAAA